MRERAQGLSFVLSGENRQLAGVPDVWACQKEQLNRTLLQTQIISGYEMRKNSIRASIEKSFHNSYGF